MRLTRIALLAWSAMIFIVAPAYADSGAITGKFGGSQTQAGISFSWNGTVRFERTSSANGIETYDRIADGTISWQASGRDPSGCTYKGQGSFSFPNGVLEGRDVNGQITIEPAGTYFGSIDTSGTAPFPGYNAWPVGVSCPDGSHYTYYFPFADWLQTKTTDHVQNGTLQGDNSFSSGSYYSERWTWDLAAPSDPLLADPGGPYRVLRGGTVKLDGSGSTPRRAIKSYRWTFAPVDCPPGVTLNRGAVKLGLRPTAVVLCTVAATLTVSDGVHKDSKETTIEVTPRDWQTRIVQKPFTFSDPGFNPPPPRIFQKFSGGSFVAELDEQLGLNVSACAGASDPLRRGPKEVVCPLSRAGSWLGRGFVPTKTRVRDPHGPFNGFYYVQSARFSIVRIGLLNHWIAPDAPADQGAGINFYDYNKQHGSDVAGYLNALEQHEGMGKPGVRRSGHTLAMQEALGGSTDGQPTDPAKFAEQQINRSRSALIRQVDKGIELAQEGIFTAAEDPLPVVWSAPLWVWSPKTGGGNAWLQFMERIGEHD